MEELERDKKYALDKLISENKSSSELFAS